MLPAGKSTDIEMSNQDEEAEETPASQNNSYSILSSTSDEEFHGFPASNTKITWQVTKRTTKRRKISTANNEGVPTRNRFSQLIEQLEGSQSKEQTT